MATSRGSTIERLASRAAKPGLQRKQMAGGGEVFTGELASRSLKAVNARAMTVDRSIIVADDFDPGNAEDQALFAHEQYHLDHSGGEGQNSGNDHEEHEARAVERMVLHRSRTGGPEMHEAAHTSAPGGAPAGSSGAGHEREGNAESAGDPSRGYAAMVAAGMSHNAIIERLAREAVQGLDGGRDQRAMRGGDKKAFL
jgi:hypothetical protein